MQAEMAAPSPHGAAGGAAAVEAEAANSGAARAEAGVEVRTVVKQLCPDCKKAFDTLEAVKAHWLEAHSTRQESSGEAASAPGAEAADPPKQEGTRRVQICPDCSKAFATKEEARAHWLETHRPPSTQPNPGLEDETGKESSSASSEVGQAKAQLIEADEEGRPVIVRHVNEQTGAARTVVMNEDGSMRMFGADTVSSMTTRAENDLREWLDAMTDRHVRGLVNEVRERLVERSQSLHSQRAEVERLSRQVNFKFFNLEEDASERQLDNAYRRLARSMHPDKNGGNEEAKQRFQAMKERYEDLKLQLQQAAEAPPVQPQQPAAHPQQQQPAENSQDDNKENANTNQEAAPEEASCKEQPRPEQNDAQQKGGKSEDRGEEKAEEAQEAEKAAMEDKAEEEAGAEGAKEDAEEERKPEEDSEKRRQQKPESRRREAYDEDEEGDRQEAASRTSAQAEPKSDPTKKRDMLVESVWKMLRQLKMIDQNLKIVERDLKRVQAEVGNVGTGDAA